MRRCRVAVGDSNPLLNTVLADALKEAGYEVVGEATTVEAMLDLVAETHPDVVTTDVIKRTRTDGISLVRSLRERWPGLRIIVASAYDDPDIARMAIDAGADAYLKKGIGLDELCNALGPAEHHSPSPQTGA